MIGLQRKISWRKILQSKPVLFILGVLIVFFSWNVFSFWNKMRETNKNTELIENKVAELKQKKEKLSKEIQNLNTTEGKERVFRENFGLTKQGEEVIVVVEDKDKPKSTENNSSTGFFSFLKNLFK